MRTLILSCNTGEGHNSCAEAIREVYAANNEVCHVKDALEFISRHASRFIAGWHTRIYRYAPKIFEAGYRGAEKKNSLFQEGTTVYRYLTSGAERLYRYILSEEYDNVICTHVFPALAVTAMLEHHPMALKTSFVATDYTCSPSVEESDLGYYFIPDASLVDEFAACGIPRERLVPCGMPVKQEFYHTMEKASAKDALGILRKHQHLLMMCGSIGCGPMKELAEELSLQLSPDQELTVVCGANEELFVKLQKKFDKIRNIHVYGMVHNVPLLMHSADLFLTKPGGLSTSEAAACGTPMVLINTVAGCEAHNLDFFIKSGIAVTAETPKMLADTAMALLADPARLQQMGHALNRHDQGTPAEIIRSLLRREQPEKHEQQQYA